MRITRALLFILAMLLAVPFVAGYAVICGVDAGARDTVRIVPVVVSVVTPGQFIDVPIYLFADEDISASSLGIKWSGVSNIRYQSATLNPDFTALGFLTSVDKSDTAIGLVGLGAYTFNPNQPIPASGTAKLLFTVRFQTKTGAVPTNITIDSSFYPPAGPFILTPTSGGTGDGVCPEYVHSAVDIRLGGVPGDADGNGVVTISDVVFLINYIFSGGPAPNPLSSGDATCNGAISISDAVYLIQYIFSGGPMPCEG